MTGQAACATALVCITLGWGCTGDRTIETRDVPLPDLSDASEAVRAQLQTKYTELTRRGASESESPEARAGAYGELGKLLLAARLLEAAEPALMNAHALMPADARWPYFLGHLYRLEGNLEEAATFFQRALAAQPDLAVARLWLGRMQLERGRLAEASAEFGRVRDVPDARFAALVGLGRVALLRADYAQAVRHLEQALATRPQASSVHYPLAMAYRGLGDNGKAEAHRRLRGSVEADPPDPWMDEVAASLDSPLTHQRLGVRALERGDLAEALVEFRQGLQLDPEQVLRVSLMHKIATTLFLMNDADGAIAQLKAAIQADPSFALNHYTMGIILASRGDLSEAADRFAEAVSLDPDYVEAHVALGNVLRQTGRASAALPHFETAVRLAPQSSDARYGFAIALSSLNRDQEAREQLQRGLEAHPDDGRLLEALGKLHTGAPGN